VRPIDDEDAPTAARVAAVERAIGRALAQRSGEQYVEELRSGGLAASDAEKIVQQFMDALAVCQFEAARREYESAGVSAADFLQGAEEVWSDERRSSRGVSVNAVASLAWTCASDAAQQAGIHLEAPAGALDSRAALGIPPAPQRAARLEPNILTALGVNAPPVVSPDGSDEMEAKILRYVSSYPNLALTSLQVQCQIELCVVLMQADKPIDVFQFEFDRFAEENGFESAVIQSPAPNARYVTLRR
jgi:hypothetical protein